MSIGVYAAIGAVILALALIYAMMRNRTRTEEERNVSEQAAAALRNDPERYEGDIKPRLQDQARSKAD